MRRHTVASRLAILSSLIVVFGCVPGLHIREVPINDAASPTEFSTYRWQPGLLQEATPNERTDSEYGDVIYETMDRAMQTLGYRRVDDDARAMILAFQLTIDDSVDAYRARTTSDTLDENSEYGLRWRLSRGEAPVQLERLTPTDEVVYFAEGILHVGAFTPELDPIWHVTGHKILDPSHSPAEHRAVLQATVRQLMQRLPSRRLDPTQRSRQ